MKNFLGTCKFKDEFNAMKNTNKKTIIGIFAVVVIAVFAINIASAYQKLCLERGQSVPSQENPRYTCNHDQCQICVDDDYYPTHPSRCDDGGCGPFGEGGGGDNGQAPNLTLRSPLNGEVYSEKKVLLDLSTNERADIYYLDLIRGRGRWTKVCTSCSSYLKSRSFSEGENRLRFRATDDFGDESFTDTTFFVDSQKPKISKTLPSKGFANGVFEVTFKEENPKELMLHYGNGEVAFRQKRINFTSECVRDTRSTTCVKNVNLTEFDGQDIIYWFDLTDIADENVDSKTTALTVDYSTPIINSINFEVDGGDVYFTIDVTEENFDKIEYIDNSESRPRWKKMCSRLDNGICEKKISLREGIHNLDIQAIDEAGNIAGRSVVVNV